MQFVNGYFRSFCGVELTPSMVSNYVKKGVVDHPIRKKYTRDQIASLMYIAVSKTVLSIENIDTLFKMQREHCSAGTAYDIFCEGRSLYRGRAKPAAHAATRSLVSAFIVSCSVHAPALFASRNVVFVQRQGNCFPQKHFCL